MKFQDYLPVGSVVRLEDGIKKIVIIGIMPIKRLESGEELAFDYLGVPYPEGYVGTEAAMLFNHADIAEFVFRGYSNEERENMLTIFQTMVDEAGKTEQENSPK